MAACMLCAHEGLRVLPMHERDRLVQVAREVLDGMASTARSEAMKAIKPARRRGSCVVERCARHVERSCGSCREVACPRCAIAAGLRAAEGQINAERDAELAAMGISDEDLDSLVDQLVANLCQLHVSFGPVLAGEWYTRRSFSVPGLSIG